MEDLLNKPEYIPLLEQHIFNNKIQGNALVTFDPRGPAGVFLMDFYAFSGGDRAAICSIARWQSIFTTPSGCWSTFW